MKAVLSMKRWFWVLIVAAYVPSLLLSPAIWRPFAEFLRSTEVFFLGFYWWVSWALLPVAVYVVIGDRSSKIRRWAFWLALVNAFPHLALSWVFTGFYSAIVTEGLIP